MLLVDHLIKIGVLGEYSSLVGLVVDLVLLILTVAISCLESKNWWEEFWRATFCRWDLHSILSRKPSMYYKKHCCRAAFPSLIPSTLIIYSSLSSSHILKIAIEICIQDLIVVQPPTKLFGNLPQTNINSIFEWEILLPVPLQLKHENICRCRCFSSLFI